MGKITGEKFKVWFKPKGQELHICDTEDRWIETEELEETLKRILQGPSKQFMENVWVVDNNDFTVFYWNCEKRLVFPELE